MKFFEKLTIISLMILLLFAGCRKRDLVPSIGAVNVRLNFFYDTLHGGNFHLPVEGISVKLTNQWNNKENSSTTNGNGFVEFNDVSAGVYNITGTITIPKNIFNSLTGQAREEDVVVNASRTKININNSTDTIIQLKMELGRVGDLVIKQIYYAGSNTTNGASYRDQFVEIYNNSNDTLYADSLYIAEVYGCSTPNPDLSKGFYITSGPMVGQFNWKKSIGMLSGIDPNDDYIYARSLYRIPGNGKMYPIPPGESIVLAQTAQNHKRPYASSKGDSIPIKDPSLTVDLSNADFEVYLAPYLATPLTSDIDNPAVPNMIMLDYFGKDWIFDNPGRQGFAIFKTDKNIPTTCKKYPDPTILAIVSGTTLYYQLPADDIIDAVEIQPNTVAARVPKRLGSRFDAGFTFNPAGAYSSQSVIRKTVKIVSGRRILMDTNNSTNDFDYLDRALPKAFK